MQPELSQLTLLKNPEKTVLETAFVEKSVDNFIKNHVRKPKPQHRFKINVHKQQL